MVIGGWYVLGLHMCGGRWMACIRSAHTCGDMCGDRWHVLGLHVW